MASLTRPHERALTLIFAELQSAAAEAGALKHVVQATEGLKQHLSDSSYAAWESLRSVSVGGIMERYANLSGNSGVVAYQIGIDSITVKFTDGWRYSYNYESAGADNVEHMKKLASRGQGLSAFISTMVRNDYARKFR